MNDFNIPINHFAADDRIKMPHLCLYMVLYQYLRQGDFLNPIKIRRKEVMQLSKISAKTTYHKCLKELEVWSYIKYKPSYHPSGKSEVYFISLHDRI